MVIFPGCKINIGLNIIDKRADGFHNIESIFYPLDFSDILEIVPNSTFTINFTGIPIHGDPSKNLVVKAYELLRDTYNLPNVAIHLHKIVPMGAGLGGGSADAAATLVLLNQMFNLSIPHERLEQMADTLGSDCAFFIRNQPAKVSGKGEKIVPFDLDLSGKYIHLIHPSIHISTQEAFSGIQPKKGPVDLFATVHDDLKTWRHKIVNDFEKTIFPKHPSIAQIKADFYQSGAEYASMTGTGSSVYGIFNQKPIALNNGCIEWISAL